MINPTHTRRHVKGWSLNSQCDTNSLNGKKHPMFDNRIYTFIHTSGKTEASTRYEFYTKYNLHKGDIGRLVNRDSLIKSVKGWKLAEGDLHTMH